MGEATEFWSVECSEGEPNFFVCMECLNEAYKAKVPTACPSCGAVSAFEAFTLDSIKEWGSEELIHKAQRDNTPEEPTGYSPPPDQSTTDSTSEQSQF